MIALFYLACLSVLATNLFWFRANFLLRERGYSSSTPWTYFRVFSNLAAAIASEKNPTQRALFASLMRNLKFSLSLTIIAFIAIFFCNFM